MNKMYLFCLNEFYWCYTNNLFIAYNFVLSLDMREWDIQFEIYKNQLPQSLIYDMEENGRCVDIENDKLMIYECEGLVKLRTITTHNFIEETLYESGMNEKCIIAFIQALCNLHKLSPYIKRDGFRSILDCIFKIYGESLWDYCNNDRVDSFPHSELYIILKEKTINPIENFKIIYNEEEVENEIKRIISE